MKVILCSIVSHFSHTALALQKAGYLKRYITGIIITNRKWKKFTDVLPLRIRKKLFGSGRYNEKLMSKLVTPLYYVEIIRKGLNWVPFVPNYHITSIINKLFSLASSLYLNECDILHVVSSQGPCLLRRAKRKNMTIILDERIAHPTYLRKLLKEEYERFGCSLHTKWLREDTRREEYEMADFIFVPSAYVFDSFVNMGINRNKLFIIPYGIDLQVFKQAPKIDKIFRITFVGTIGFRKGTYYLLEAYKQLQLKNAELVLIGKIEKTFRNVLHKYQGIFRHIDFMPQMQLYRFYGNSSVFVLPSLAEGSALVTYEAMACELPTIVTSNCGAVVRDGKDGFVIPIRDVEALKERILVLYENENLRRQMGDSAKEYVKNFTWERYGERVLDVYQKIMTIKGISPHG